MHNIIYLDTVCESKRVNGVFCLFSLSLINSYQSTLSNAAHEWSETSAELNVRFCSRSMPERSFSRSPVSLRRSIRVHCCLSNASCLYSISLALNSMHDGRALNAFKPFQIAIFHRNIVQWMRTNWVLHASNFWATAKQNSNRQRFFRYTLPHCINFTPISTLRNASHKRHRFDR